MGIWDIMKEYIQKVYVVKMRMLKWMCKIIIKDRKRNILIHNQLGLDLIEDKIEETRLRWY